MAVISLSIDEETKNLLESLEEEGSFDSRSELVRTALRKMNQQRMPEFESDEEFQASIWIEHKREFEDEISEIIHNFDGEIRTQLHNRLSDEKCLEFLNAESEFGEIKSFFKKLEGSRYSLLVQIRFHR